MSLVEELTSIGPFATDALVNTEITNQGWTKRIGICYYNTVFQHMRYWDGGNWFPVHDPPKSKMYNSALQTINNTTWTTVVFDTGVYDDGIRSGNTFVCPTNGGGVYHVGFGLAFVANTTGVRSLVLRVAGTTRAAFDVAAMPTGGTRLMVQQDMKLTSAQVVDFRIWQNSGGALNTTPGLNSVWAYIHYIGPG